jgi:hypothetical protein
MSKLLNYINISLRSFLLFALVAFCVSCEKDIDIKLPAYKEKLVVEASIETGKPTQVLLSMTAPYFGNVDLSDPSRFFVKGAFITVTDGNVVDTLRALDPSTGYFYLGTKILGQVGRSYLLTIKYNDETYTGVTNILNPIPLDSIYFKAERDTFGYCWGHLTEPAGQGNCYRWFAKRITKDQVFVAPYNSAFDDKFIDGTSFEFSYERPPQPDERDGYGDTPNAGYYNIGDTVIVKFCTMGNTEYLFWRSYYSNQASNGNPFAAPANIQSNVTGGNVIGAFCGYSPSFDTLVIKK